MEPQTMRELWTAWQALWNGDLTVADAIIALDFVAHFAPAGNSPDEVRGPAGLKGWISGSLGVFPDGRFATAVGPLVEGDMMIERWRFQATYRGGIPGSPPDVIGKAVEYAGIDMLRIEAGQIAKNWPCADILQMLQQIGVIPS